MRFKVRSVRLGETVVDEQVIEASDQDALRRDFDARGLVILRAQAVRGGWGAASASTFAPASFRVFCREVKTLLYAGMTVVEAVETLAARDQMRSSGHGGLAEAILQKLLVGQALSVALAGVPGRPQVLVAAIKAGERTSNVADALDDFIRFDEQVEQLKRKVVSAALYPAVVIALGAGITLFLILVVMPSFARMYDNLRGGADGMTALVIYFSQWIGAHRGMMAVSLVMLLLVLAWLVASGLAARAALRLSLQVNWIRRRVIDFELAMTYQALTLLLKGGYPLTQAMLIAEQSALSADVRDRLVAARSSIEAGGGVSGALANEALCDEIARRLLAAAERNGEFHLATRVVAKLYGERFELFVDRMTRLVEPLLLLAVALVVGFVVVVMYLPVFDMATRLR